MSGSSGAGEGFGRAVFASASEVLFDEEQEALGGGPGGRVPGCEATGRRSLIDTPVDLLFYFDLTVPKQPHGKPKISYADMADRGGVQYGDTYHSRSMRATGCEILRLLLTSGEPEHVHVAEPIAAERDPGPHLSLHLPRQAGGASHAMLAPKHRMLLC